MRKRVLSILLALSVILAYVPMMGITAVAEVGGVDTTPLTFTSNHSFSVVTDEKGWDGDIEYRTNGSQWTEWDGTTEITAGGSDGSYTLMFKGKHNKKITSIGDEGPVPWTIEGNNVKVSGNIMTLLDDGYNTSLADAADADEYTFAGMFCGCEAITDVSQLKLPETTLNCGCYYFMFYGCKNLTNAPELPARNLAADCYHFMFSGCTSLTEAPDLPALTMEMASYARMFSGCANLKETPELPATSIADSCYLEMFSGCTSLTNAPELPARNLAEDCYHFMFSGCTSLTEAMKLPATTLKYSCYSGMFSGCTSLTEAPEISATNLALYCCSEMFKDCTSLIAAPELPATSVNEGCYCEMFSGCTSLTKAPELKATIMADECYCNMFKDCDNLSEVPSLPATVLAHGCYSGMFSGCTSIKLYEESPSDDCEPWGIPSGVETFPEFWNTDMFCDTGGDFTGNPVAGDTYYYLPEGHLEITQQPSATNEYTVAAKVIPEPDTQPAISYQWYKVESGEENDTVLTGQTSAMLSEGTTGQSYYCVCNCTYDEKELTATSNRVTYVASVVVPASIVNPHYYVSLTLGDKIDVNFKMVNGENLNEDLLGIIVDGESIPAKKITVSGNQASCVLCSKAPQDADRTFNVQVTYKENDESTPVVIKSFDYKVRDYCRNLITKSEKEGSTISAEFVNLCKAFLIYTTCSDICDAGDGTDYEGTDMQTYLGQAMDIKPVDNGKAGDSKASLTIDSGISLNFIINTKDVSKADITEDKITIKNDRGELVDIKNNVEIPANQDGDEVKVIVKNLGASKLGKTYTLTVSGYDDFEINYGVYNYIANQCGENSTASENTKNFYKAMYFYGEAARNYYEKIGFLK